MSRAKPQSVTGMGVAASPLGREQQDELWDLLAKMGLKNDAAEHFVRGVNGAIVFAYDLNPKMSLRSQQIAWFNQVQKAVEKLQAALGVIPDSRSEKGILTRTAVNEELESLNRFPGGRALDFILGCVVKRCKARKEKLGKPKRKGTVPTPRQVLANELASLWRLHFDKIPTCNSWEARNSTPFMEALDWILFKIDVDYKMYYTGYTLNADERQISALGQIAHRAIQDLHKRDETERRYHDTTK